MTLMQEFHADHQEVAGGPFEWRRAIAASEIVRVCSIPGAAGGVLGPHFRRSGRMRKGGR